MDDRGKSKSTGQPGEVPKLSRVEPPAPKTNLGLGLPPKLAAASLSGAKATPTSAAGAPPKLSDLLKGSPKPGSPQMQKASRVTRPVAEPKPVAEAPKVTVGQAKVIAEAPKVVVEAPKRHTQANASRPAASVFGKPIPPRAHSVPPRPQTEPAVLAVGSDDAILVALKAALARHGVFVESAEAGSVVETVIAAAPDLILLLGDAAKDCGRATLEKLSASPQSSVVPVAIMDDNMALDARLQAFRYGVTAVIPRSASIDAIAEKVARLAKEIPYRGTDSPEMVGESTLEEFVAALSSELRTGILSVGGAETPPDQAIRLVLGGGKLLAEFVDDFVKRVRTHVVSAEPLTYEFDERAGGTLGLLGSDSKAKLPVSVKGLRLALADNDAARADTVAQELRSHGAQVFVIDLSPSEARLSKLRQLDPAVLLIGENHLTGEGHELVRRMRRDARLRWASLLVLRWDELFADPHEMPIVERLSSSLATLVEPERSLLERANSGLGFDTRLETTGPARLLRGLKGCSQLLRLNINNPRINVALDVAEGLIVGASAVVMSPVPAQLSGPLALAAYLVLGSGRVHVERAAAAADANIMATIDVALDLAEAETPPISPSIPAPARAVEPVATPSVPPLGKLPVFDVPDPPPMPVSMAAPVRERPPPPSAQAQVPSVIVASAVNVDPSLDQEFRRESPGRNQRKPEARIGWQMGVLWSVLGVVQLALAAGVVLAVVRVMRGSSPAAAASVAVVEKATVGAAVQPPKGPEPTEVQPQPSVASAALGQPPSKQDPEPPPPAQVAEAKSELMFPRAVQAPTCEFLLEHAEAPRGGFSKDSSVALGEGHKALVKGNVDAAQTAFCRAAMLDAANPRVQLALAQLLILRGDGTQGEAVASRALALHGETARAKGLLGDALIIRGDLDGARAAWLDAAGLTASDAAAIQKLTERALWEGEASVRNKDYARSERFFWRMLAFFRDDPDANLGMARTYLYRGDLERALSWARRSVRLSPDAPRARVVLGDVLLRSGDAKAAILEWQAAQRIDPKSLEAKARLESANKLK
ncbi:MAG: tetratricopeptide repeat protein [Polyangiaceae bacterium]|nr:tetratricopeptide repeat protein [Polyangiaceae bacterium]